VREQTCAPILLVEDNRADAILTDRALRKNRIANELVVVETGADALDYLHRRNGYRQAVRPAFILLDLNLPGVSGQEVLAELKAHETLRTIPVVVLTSSESDIDVVGAYTEHANAYMVKPVDFDKLVAAMAIIGEHWLSIVRLSPT